MSIYIPPATNAVDFAAESFTPADLTPANQPLSATSPAARTAVDFALTVYTQPTYPYVGWELLPGAGSVTAALAWTEESDVFAVAGTVRVSAALAWTEADDTFAVSGAVAVTSALAWTEDDDVWAVSGVVSQPVPVQYAGGGGGSSWFAASKEEERRLLNQIEAILRETLTPNKAAPVLARLARVDTVAMVRLEVERLAEQSRADAQALEVLADVQARIAIFVARQKRRRQDEELMMVM
jgi:hypothetical protein